MKITNFQWNKTSLDFAAKMMSALNAHGFSVSPARPVTSFGVGGIAIGQDNPLGAENSPQRPDFDPHFGAGASPQRRFDPRYGVWLDPHSYPLAMGTSSQTRFDLPFIHLATAMAEYLFSVAEIVELDSQTGSSAYRSH